MFEGGGHFDAARGCEQISILCLSAMGDMNPIPHSLTLIILLHLTHRDPGDLESRRRGGGERESRPRGGGDRESRRTRSRGGE